MAPMAQRSHGLPPARGRRARDTAPRPTEAAAGPVHNRRRYFGKTAAVRKPTLLRREFGVRL